MLEIFRQTCFNRHFEYCVAEGLKEGHVRPPIYLSVGSEFIPPVLKSALIKKGITRCNIFPQHRGHSYHLTFADKPLELAYELCGSKKGCNKGYGGSASISHNEGKYQIWGHSGLLGDQVPIAVGAAHASQTFTVCILGDAAAEEDYVLGALGYAVTKKCPILFIVEDNGLSILTPTAERRSWDIVKVAQSMGIIADTIQQDEWSITPFSIESHISSIINRNGPSLLNIKVCRHFWHVGAGEDGIKYDFLDDFKKIIPEHQEIEEEEKTKARKIWDMVKNDNKRND
jgi:acetoin:2,6-dichlorophenolindophenol oxidoreductase subunit alpha